MCIGILRIFAGIIVVLTFDYFNIRGCNRNIFISCENTKYSDTDLKLFIFYTVTVSASNRELLSDP